MKRHLVLFSLVFLLTVGMIAFRYVKTEKQTAAPVGSGLAADERKEPSNGITPVQAVPNEAPERPETEPVPDEESDPQPYSGAEGPTAGPAEPAVLPSEEEPVTAKPYTEKTYQLVSDLVYVCREEGTAEGGAKIAAILDELETEDKALARLWRGITDELAAVCADGAPAPGLPDGLPQDDSLCFAVLGFQLLYDGDMAPELLGRCETALQALRQYPKAYVAVTGGGTAFGNRKATEADVMAAWFQAQGIAPERIIIENRSLTTDQNAVNTCAILTESYPQIREIVVITSDYHMALGRMMFTEAALLHAWRSGGAVPYTVQGGPSWATSGSDEYSGERNIMPYVWVMANPSYGNGA